jgi:hypothetical protein
MSLEHSNRKNSIKDADLIGLADRIRSTMTRDLAELSEFGITAGKITEFGNLTNEFLKFPQDTVYLSDLINVTQKKNQSREAIKEEIRKSVQRCRLKWGANSLQEKSLGIVGMANFSDENLLFASRRVHGQMTILLPELADVGLTQAILDNFENLNISFESEINNKKDIINLRETQTKLRISKANELFELISKYCELGKQVFFMTNEAHYNDYLIHKKRKKKAKKPVVAAVESD